MVSINLFFRINLASMNMHQSINGTRETNVKNCELKSPGSFTVTVTADGLEPATVKIQTH